MKIDAKPEIEQANKLLNKISKLGTLGIFVVNALFVLILAYICAKWEGTSPGVKKFLQVSIIVLAFICLLIVPFIYLVFRYIDSIIIPKAARSLEEQKQSGNTTAKTHTDS